MSRPIHVHIRRQGIAYGKLEEVIGNLSCARLFCTANPMECCQGPLLKFGGRAIYGMRLAIGEPPFADLRRAIGLNRFTLRSKRKVNTQWNLFCIVHSLKKIQRYGQSYT